MIFRRGEIHYGLYAAIQQLYGNKEKPQHSKQNPHPQIHLDYAKHNEMWNTKYTLLTKCRFLLKTRGKTV